MMKLLPKLLPPVSPESEDRTFLFLLDGDCFIKALVLTWKLSSRKSPSELKLTKLYQVMV